MLQQVRLNCCIRSEQRFSRRLLRSSVAQRLAARRRLRRQQQLALHCISWQDSRRQRIRQIFHCRDNGTVTCSLTAKTAWSALRRWRQSGFNDCGVRAARTPRTSTSASITVRKSLLTDPHPEPRNNLNLGVRGRMIIENDPSLLASLVGLQGPSQYDEQARSMM